MKRVQKNVLNMTRPRHVGTLGSLKIWYPFKQIFFKYLLNISTVEHTLFSIYTADVLAPPYKFAPQAAAQLTRFLMWP
jgi:hypothetical protein